MKAAIFGVLSVALASAQTSSTYGAWSVYQNTGNHADAHVTLIQTRTPDKDASGNTTAAELDVVCHAGKVRGLAVKMQAAVLASAVNLKGQVETVQVQYNNGQANGSGQWAVLDGRHTVSPYSETSQGKWNRMWLATLASGHQLVLQLPGPGDDSVQKISFETTGFSDALASAGCTY